MAKRLGILILFACMALGISSSSAMAETAIPTGSSTSVTVTTTTEGGSKSASAPVFIRFYVLSYVKAEGLSKKEVANAEECKMIGEGTDVPVYTNSGILISTGAFGTFEDTDLEKACKVNGVWRLVRCGNQVWFFIKPNIIQGHVLLVRTFAHKRIRIHIPLHVKINGNCGAEAVSKIDQWVKYSALVKAKGDVKIRISGKIIDRIKAHVHVQTHCENVEKVEKTESVVETPGPPKPPSKIPNCSEKPEAEKCKPIVTIETINDMEASANGHHHTRYICWDVKPGAESTLATIETGLYVKYGVEKGSVEYRGGSEFCQLYESPSEPVLEEYHAWAKDKKTLAYGESPHETFPVNAETPF